MISDRIEARLTRDRPMTSITLRIPVDVAQFAFGPAARLIEVLKKRGVPESVLEEAVREVHPA